MATKVKRRNLPQVLDDKVLRKLQNMTFRDIQKACILRGMNFIDVVSLGYYQLRGFYIENYENKIDAKKLDAFDEWMRKQLKERGYSEDHPMMDASFNFGYVGEYDEEGNPTATKRVSVGGKGIKKPKKAPVAKNEFGVREGTAKALVYELTLKEGIDNLKKITKKVCNKFPDANPNSIKIWMGRARKSQKK